MNTYFLKENSPEQGYAIISDGDTDYRVSINEAEAEVLEFATSNDLYNYLRNNDAEIIR